MAKPRWFRFSLRTLFVLVTVVAIGCGSQTTPMIAPGKYVKTRTFSQFKTIESVHLMTRLGTDEFLEYQIPESEWPDVAAILENGIPYDCIDKLAISGELHIRADGAAYEFWLFENDRRGVELILKSGHKYWRGISAPELAKFMRDHGTPVDPKKVGL